MRVPTRINVLPCALLTVLAAFATDAPVTASAAGAASTGAAPARETSAAPDFSRADLDGASIKLSEFRGKVVLLNFWATWCAPCLVEMPRFSQWQQAYGSRGLQILGVSMDDSREPVVRLAHQRPPGYPLIMGDAALAKLYGGVYGLPTTFLIDGQGRVVARYRGEADLKELEAKILSLLPAQGR